MKLGLKIIGALILVVAVALVSASWLIDRNTGQTYRSYLDDARARQQAQLAEQVAALRADGQNWRTIQGWLDDLPPGLLGAPPAPMHNDMGMGHMNGGMRGPMRHRDGEDTLVGSEPGLQYLLIDPDSGAPLAGSGPSSDAGESAASDTGSGSVNLQTESVPIVVNDRTVANLVLRQPVSLIGQAEEAVLKRTQEAILMAAGLSGIVALVLGALLVWTLLRPLGALQAGVQRISQGDYEVQVAVNSRDELGQLARGFNAMSAQLHRQETLRRQMIADIAHELRTPLSIIQGNLQAMLDGVYPLDRDEIGTVYRESQLLSRLINDLHELAQAEAGVLPLERQHIRVDDVLHHMAGIFTPLATARDVTLSVQPTPGEVTVDADPDRLQQILYNLLGNALRHTPNGGSVHLAAQPIGDCVRFTVRDTGPGIPAEHLPYVFERFYRIDKSRRRSDSASAAVALPGDSDGISGRANIPSPPNPFHRRTPAADVESEAPAPTAAAGGDHTAGAGLGLAIVRALAEAHGGAVGADSRANGRGEGATFWVDLPLPR